MSVLIKDMGMPRDGAYWCEIGVAGNIATITIHGEDRKSFHLIELPDHGDLIEKDPLFKKAEELEKAASAEFERYKLGETNWEQREKAKWRIAHLERIGFKYEITDAPVVIPAERSEDGET